MKRPMHPSDCIGKRVRVRTHREEHVGFLKALEDWGIAGGGNYLILERVEPDNERPSGPVVAVAMRALAVFEPLD